MSLPRVSSSAGFTLLAAMVAIVIMGIMLGAAGQSWRTFMQREREEELLFRGTQIRDAIARWHKPVTTPGAGQSAPRGPLRELKDLLEDPHSLGREKFLRRLYLDPITNKEFETILDPVGGGIAGVRSTSQDPPLKSGNFPDDLKDFANKVKYSEWEFNYLTAAALVKDAAVQQGTIDGLPPSTLPNATPGGSPGPIPGGSVGGSHSGDSGGTFGGRGGASPWRRF